MNQTLCYNGKKYDIPTLSAENPFCFMPERVFIDYDEESQVIKDLNSIWDMGKFKTARAPVSFGKLPTGWRESFDRATGRYLDLPIKFPGTDYRLPRELENLFPTIRWIADLQMTVNPQYDDYYCYLTFHSDFVKRGTLEREAPCHVDGFQGARKVSTSINHSFTVSNCLPTAYYVQPFSVDKLDVTKHDFFWEFNRQVAMTNSRHAITHEPYEITMMDAYCVHRGVEAPEDTPRNWLRMSYEKRIFDRLGNTHNPLFDYNWEMVERDIEQLNLVAYDQDCDPSLRVFPWQALDGSPNPKGVKTKPNLKPRKPLRNTLLDAFRMYY
jgi:hypothetical protein